MIARGLADAGTRVVYGVPGGGNNLEVVGACERAGLRFVLAHGENAAAVMAGVDGELRGAPGACVVTRGPGVASAVNGVAQSQLDRQPMVLISDAVALRDRGRVSHQRLDQDALLAPVTKWSATVGIDGRARRRGGDRDGRASSPGRRAPLVRPRCAASADPAGRRRASVR